MKKISIIINSNDIDLIQWNELVLNHPNGNFFQSPLAFDFFYSINEYQPILISAKEDDKLIGVLLAVFIYEAGMKKFFSRRCIVWGGPLCYERDTANQMLDELINNTKYKNIYTEFRNLFNMDEFDLVLKEKGFKYINWLNYIVSIDGIDFVRKRINDSKRRQISKSLKSGAKISEAKNIYEVQELYSLLLKLYKDKIKKPLPSFEFFKRFYSNKMYGKIFIIEYNGRIIGGTICPIYKYTIYEWYVCGLDREIKDVYPSVLATWAPIEYAAKNGFKYFDFLGAGSPNSDYGVREFKSQFGGELINSGRYLRVNNRLLYNLGKIGLKIWQKNK